MNIFPMNKSDADKKHWVVGLLRFNGFLITAGAMISGVFCALAYGNILLGGIFNGAYGNIVPILLAVIGALVGFVAGLILSLPWWAISMVLDDLHAMRQYMQGFVVLDDNRTHEV